MLPSNQLTSRQAEEGFYFRVAHNDHSALSHLIAERRLIVEGLVFDARRHDRHAELRREAEAAVLATCLDTQAMELAMPGTNSKGHAELPWAKARIRSPEDFKPSSMERYVGAIVERVRDGGYSEVMAPSHYLGDRNVWLETDAQLTRLLRSGLDSAGQKAVRIIYPLALHHSGFYEESIRSQLLRVIASLPIDTVSLRVHPFGANSGPLVLRHFIEACWRMRESGVPVMLERAGLAGLAVFALGGVERLQSGILMGDSFDVGHLQALPAREGRFGPPQRIFIEALGASVELSVAEALMKSSVGKLQLTCNDPTCCRDGRRSMLSDPHRHSALARQRQYTQVARVPPSMRAEHFLHEVYGPITDKVWKAGEMHEPLKKAHRRMLSIKEVLSDLIQQRRASRVRSRRTTDLPAKPPATVIPFPRNTKGR